jgi:transposase-like protein
LFVRPSLSVRDYDWFPSRNQQIGNITHTGRLPEVKRQIVDMALNGSGICETARLLKISPMTVMTTLKKKGPRFAR